MNNYREETIAYALATGIAPLSSHEIDTQIDRDARRARWMRRKANKG